MIQPNVKEEDLPFALENIAFAHMDRVKTFAVVLTRSALVRARKCAGLDAPFLTALTVAVDDYREGDSLVWLTQASWPHLRSLECHYGTVRHLQALLRPTLTSLIVEYIEPCVTVEVLLDLLSGLPHLTTLKILHCLTPIDSLPTAPPGSSAPIVSLPQLRFFEIGEGAVGISEAHLLNHLKFSSNTEVHFSNQVSSTLADISYIVSAFVAKASGVPGSMGSAKAFKVEEWLFFGTKISVYSQVVPDFWDRGEHILWDLERLSPTATLGLMGSQQDVVSSFISQYPLSDVHSVCCRSSELDEMEPWHLLAQLPSVQELHLEHTPRTAFACFLECLKEQHTFSSLQFLRLSHIVWNKCHSSARRQDMRVGSLVPPLLRAIKYRQQHGPRLHTLQLPYAINLFENDDEDLERLSRMVDKFRCSDWEDPDEPDECSTCYSSGSEGETASDAEGSSDEDPETDETDTSDDLDADGEEEP
ncbi:hypothetical protein PsYK624_061490 [Phanerochaete sordida]|uniref:F-box domain-containing protein n=1 Tax=Phanerochaete sordida TaxID=48140 RepID=A0A9P3LD71_9APHY|nr:hypothetical protein PsYK624_061490 [Phanerochaete sordida]